jgi:hypothetical protein
MMVSVFAPACWRRLAVVLLLIALGGTAGVAAAKGHRKHHAHDRVLVVDIRSLGGHCSDARALSAVGITTPLCSLTRALALAPSGSAIRVRSGAYPTLWLPYFSRRSRVTVEGFGNEHPFVEGVEIGTLHGPRSRHLTLQGLRIGNPGIGLTNFDHIQIIGDEIALSPVAPTGCSSATQTCDVHTPAGIRLNMPGSNLAIEHNYIHDGSFGVQFENGSPPAGPHRPLSTTYRNVSVNDNTFARMGDVVVELENFENATVSGNRFMDDRARSDVNPYCHCDSVHVIGGGDGLHLNKNVVTGGRGFLLQPGAAEGNCKPRCETFTRVHIDYNELLGPDFSMRVISSPGVRIVGNTIWGSEPGGDLGLTLYADTPATTRAVILDNIIRDFALYGAVGVAREGYNYIEQWVQGPGLRAHPGRRDVRVFSLQQARTRRQRAGRHFRG